MYYGKVAHRLLRGACSRGGGGGVKRGYILGGRGIF